MFQHSSYFSAVLAITLFIFAGIIGIPTVGAEEKQTAYDKILKNKYQTQTIRTMGSLLMALPHEFDNIYPQLAKSLWCNHPKLKMDKMNRAIEMGKLKENIKTIMTLFSEHDVRYLRFSGYTPVGSSQCIDYYFSTETLQGPLIVRVSIIDPKDQPIIIYVFQSYMGWHKARQASSQILHKAGDFTLTITYTPKAKKQESANKESPEEEKRTF